MHDRPAARGGRLPSADVTRWGHVAPRHLARRYVARASGGRCRRSRQAGGPTRAAVCGCCGCDGQRVRKDHALGVRKETSCDAPLNIVQKWPFLHPSLAPPPAVSAQTQRIPCFKSVQQQEFKPKWHRKSLGSASVTRFFGVTLIMGRLLHVLLLSVWTS